MKKEILLLTLYLCFYPFPIFDIPTHSEFIIWNIGQGQWVTWVEANTCTHLDMGGENFPWKKILKLCSFKKNQLYFTHKDSDHTNAAYLFWKKRKLDTCRMQNLSSPPYKKKLLEIPPCDSTQYTQIQTFDPPSWIKPKDANYHSHVFLLHRFLVPGDSTKQAEAHWVDQIPKSKPQYLILGHHGSKTSTSAELLDHLPHVKQCISSAREKKYGHPHPSTLKLLKQKKCPHVSTEKWGHLHYF